MEEAPGFQLALCYSQAEQQIFLRQQQIFEKALFVSEINQ